MEARVPRLPNAEVGIDGGGVGWLERVIPLCPYVPNPLIDNIFAKLRLGGRPHTVLRNDRHFSANVEAFARRPKKVLT